MRIANRTIAQSEDQGSWPTLFAIAEDVPGDSFIGPDGPGQSRGYPHPVGRSRAAQDAETARRLWELSERLTGVTFDLR